MMILLADSTEDRGKSWTELIRNLFYYLKNPESYYFGFYSGDKINWSQQGAISQEGKRQGWRIDWTEWFMFTGHTDILADPELSLNTL